MLDVWHIGLGSRCEAQQGIGHAQGIKHHRRSGIAASFALPCVDGDVVTDALLREGKWRTRLFGKNMKILASMRRDEVTFSLSSWLWKEEWASMFQSLD